MEVLEESFTHLIIIALVQKYFFKIIELPELLLLSTTVDRMSMCLDVLLLSGNTPGRIPAGGCSVFCRFGSLRVRVVGDGLATLVTEARMSSPGTALAAGAPGIGPNPWIVGCTTPAFAGPLVANCDIRTSAALPAAAWARGDGPRIIGGACCL